jgi:hypothetical protein
MAVSRETSPRRLFVEGPNDQHTVIQLMKRHVDDWDTRLEPIDVSAAGGIKSLLKPANPALPNLLSGPALPNLLSGPYTHAGVVVDADGSVSTRWNEVSAVCQAHGVDLPKQPDPAGTVLFDVGRPRKRFGVWLMPDNVNPGALEHFLATLIPAGEPCWARAGEAVKDAKANECATAELLKHQMRTWLAWQDDPGYPGMPPGMALQTKALGHDSPEALAFVAWFRRLFD